MKDIDEIKNTSGMIIKAEGEDGFGGTVFPVEYKNGKVKIIKDIEELLQGGQESDQEGGQEDE